MVQKACSADQEVADLAQEVLTYLDRHPNAADTLEGIATWWLARQRYEAALSKVERALDRLVERGVVEKRDKIGGYVVYARRRRKRTR